MVRGKTKNSSLCVADSVLWSCFAICAQKINIMKYETEGNKKFSPL